MKIKFTFEEQELQKTVQKFVKNDLMTIYREINKTGNMPDDVYKKFLSMGILKTVFPAKYSGVEGTFTGFILAIKEFAHVSFLPPLLLLENFSLAMPIYNFGSDFLKDSYLKDIISLKKIGALAFTETDTGSDPQQLKTIAKKVSGGWSLNGSKRFITNSGICDYIIIFAKLEDGGVAAFLVNSKNKGYIVGKREIFMHSDAMDNGDIYLQDCCVPEDHLVGSIDQGFEILLNAESINKICFCALFVGVGERALELAVNYANTKLHRNKSIGQKFQMIQSKIARMAVMVESMKAYLFHVCAKMDKDNDIFRDAAILKLLISENIKQITSDAMEIHGAYGLCEEYDVADLYRVAISAQVVMGCSDIQRVIVAQTTL